MFFLVVFSVRKQRRSVKKQLCSKKPSGVGQKKPNVDQRMLNGFEPRLKQNFCADLMLKLDELR